MAKPDFDADCGRCFGLCCVALSFERSAQFGHDKPAGQPCHFLESDFKCRIHVRREELGYEGCEAFDCLGAGQRASALFADKDWHGDAAIKGRLYSSFSVLMRLQEMRQALETAADLELDADQDAQRCDLLAHIAGIADSGQEDNGEAADVLAKAKKFLRLLGETLAA